MNIKGTFIKLITTAKAAAATLLNQNKFMLAKTSECTLDLTNPFNSSCNIQLANSFSSCHRWHNLPLSRLCGRTLDSFREETTWTVTEAVVSPGLSRLLNGFMIGIVGSMLSPLSMSQHKLKRGDVLQTYLANEPFYLIHSPTLSRIKLICL